MAEAALALVLFSGRGGDLPDQVAPGDYARTGNSVTLTSCDLIIDCQRRVGDLAFAKTYNLQREELLHEYGAVA